MGNMNLKTGLKIEDPEWRFDPAQTYPERFQTDACRPGVEGNNRAVGMCFFQHSNTSVLHTYKIRGESSIKINSVFRWSESWRKSALKALAACSLALAFGPAVGLADEPAF